MMGQMVVKSPAHFGLDEDGQFQRWNKGRLLPRNTSGTGNQVVETS